MFNLTRENAEWGPDRRRPSRKYRTDECEGICQRTTKVKLRYSMTGYVWDGKGEDPNKEYLLCDECWEEYREYWQERWDEYYSQLL